MGLAAAAAVAGIAGAGVSAYGALSSSGKAASGSQQSQAIQQQATAKQQENAAPFINAGGQAANQLAYEANQNVLGLPMDLSGQPTAAQTPQYTGGAPPTFSWDPTMAGLAQTPGYQFTQQQGLMGVQSSAAARGLGVSGAALRGAADYSSGLAASTYNQQLNNAESIYGQQLAGFGQGLNAYDRQLAGFTSQQGAFQNQFNDFWANQNNRYNQLAGLSSQGANAAVGAGTNATNAASNVGNAAAQAGQFQAAGTTGALNTIGNNLASPQTASALNTGYNALFGGGSTVSPSQVAANQTYENQQFAQQPTGTYGPFA